MWRIALYLKCITISALALDTKIHRAMLASGIEPELVFEAPKLVLNVNYENGKVFLGNKLKPDVFIEEPTSISWPADPRKMYTLVFLDVDSEFPGKNAGNQFLYWMVVNIPGNNVKRGQTLYEYMDPSSMVNKGCHRSVFLVYEHQDGPKYFPIDKVDKNTIGNRADFVLFTFCFSYKLVSLFAGNFFWAQYEPVERINPDELSIDEAYDNLLLE